MQWIELAVIFVFEKKYVVIYETNGKPTVDKNVPVVLSYAVFLHITLKNVSSERL